MASNAFNDRELARRAGHKGGIAKVKKGFAKTGLAISAGRKGGLARGGTPEETLGKREIRRSEVAAFKALYVDATVPLEVICDHFFMSHDRVREEAKRLGIRR